MITDWLWNEVDEIDGWLTRREADLLLRLAEPPWLEVGSYCGRSARVLAEVGPGVCVDDFSEPGSSPALIERLPDVVLVKGDFRDAGIEGTFRFLHLDADHSFSGTLAAFDRFAPMVEPGCFMVIHDAWPHDSVASYNPWPEVTRFVAHMILDPLTEWDLFANEGRSAAFRKR